MFGHQVSREATSGERTEAKAQPGVKTLQEEEDEGTRSVSDGVSFAGRMSFCFDHTDTDAAAVTERRTAAGRRAAFLGSRASKVWRAELRH